MGNDNGPSLTDVILDKIPGGSYIKSFLGFFDNHKALEAGAIAGFADEIMGDGMIGSAIGGATAALLEKEGMPVWMSSLAGVGIGALAKTHPFEAIMGAAVLAVGYYAFEKMFGNSDQPSPNMAPQPAH